MRVCVVENDDIAFTGIHATLRNTSVEVVRICGADALRPGDIVIQGSGPLVLTDPMSSRIEIVGQADDDGLIAALERSDFVLERPFDPARLVELVQDIAQAEIPLRRIPFFVAPECWRELKAIADRPNATSRDYAVAVSRDLGLSLLIFRLAGSVSSPHYYPTISGSIVRIGPERLTRLLRKEALGELVSSRTMPEAHVWQVHVLKLAEVARAYIPDELLAAIAYIVTILSVLPDLLQVSIPASRLVQLLHGPTIWVECLQELEDGDIERPIPAAIYAAEHRLARRTRSAVFNLRSAG